MSTQVRERLSRLDARGFSPARLPFGLTAGESIAAFVGLVLVIWAVAYYFTSLGPQQDQLRLLESQLVAQQKNIISNTTPAAAPEKTPQDQARETLETLETFRSAHLKPFSPGRIELIKEINALAKKNNVTLTSGIDMGGNASSADANKSSGKTGGSQQRNKLDEILSAFPSVGFHFSVFGQYADLRAFIHQLEQEKHFLVVRSINLSSQEAKTSSRRARGEGLSGIVLTIEMTAYFRP
jgi:hypothetical protein